MSYLKELNHEGLANILICPHCGSESFTPKMECSLQCNECERWLYMGSVNMDFGMKPNRIIHVLVGPMMSKDDWDWKLKLEDGRVCCWATWDKRYEEQRIDTRSYGEIKTLMNNKWEAYKVTKALTSSFKKQAAG